MPSTLRVISFGTISRQDSPTMSLGSSRYTMVYPNKNPNPTVFLGSPRQSYAIFVYSLFLGKLILHHLERWQFV
jgi:hypothetical protein